MSNKSGTSSQAITLPSGGGALQGIGETFTPDLFTGTGNFTVPLAMPAGRNGFQPQLSLAYSTGTGNGPYGLGWTLGVPEVSRKTSKGIPRYLDLTADPAQRDTFLISGSEDLVPVSQPAPGITRYRPRTEGLFARIERVHAGSDDFWRISTKDGLVSLYGTPGAAGNDPAVVADPARRSKVFRWQLSQTTDPFGNRIQYQYLRDSGSDGSHTFDELYLQNVQYVDYDQDGQTRFLVSVSFDYAPRPDPFSDARAGFEVRTRLRCKRIAIHTQADQDWLARTIDLVYVDERVDAHELPTDRRPRNGVSLLSLVRVTGHDGDQTQSLPPLEFGYTPFVPEQRRFQPIQSVNNTLPRRSLADADLDTVSLFANGLPDIVQMNGAVRLWRNLGNGLFDAPQDMTEVPAGIHLRDAGVHFADMNGNGRADLLVLEQGGYFPLSFQGRWSPQGFVHYQRTPQVSFGEQELRLVDLDGDGVIDALRTGASAFELFFNHPTMGWDDVQEVPRGPLDAFPNVSFSSPQVKLADLNGDKLQDIVLVEQGQLSYWPYLGHGQWGRRIRMQLPGAASVFGANFDPRRLQFGDVDGDGLDDIMYLDANQVTFWINQSGNGWSQPQTIPHTPIFTDVNAVRLADVLGTGMAGVLWTFDQTTGEGSNFQFMDLTGGLKPYLLTEMDNHRGSVTRVQYVPSTRFYLEDVEKPETRWKTLLPFPVQVMERMEVIDAVSGGKLTTQYLYHHGYWDGVERELRGFGRVEQLDTEVFEEFNSPGLHGPGAAFETVTERTFSPPLLTKTWFHPGPVGDEFAVRTETDFTPEYFSDDPLALKPPASRQQLLQSLPATRRGDALRSLRGQVLRTEVYALDGTERQNRPFTVTESQYSIREESVPAAGAPRVRVFFPHPVAQRTTRWERGDEPMTQFSFTDDYDQYGQPRRQVSLAVPRSRDYRQPAPAVQPYLGTLTTTRFAQRDDAQQYIVDRVAATEKFEILNDGSQTVFDLYGQVQQGSASLALFGQSFTYYDGEAFAGLPLGQLGDFGARVRSESLVMAEALLREAYGDPADPNAPPVPPYLQPGGAASLPAEYPPEFQELLPTRAGYTFADGLDGRARGYFVQAERVAFDFHRPDLPHRGLPLTTHDAFGHDTTVVYDHPFDLLPVQVTDPAGMTIRADYDYRVLQPRLVTDENANRRAVRFNPLGLVAASAVMGKDGEAAGDTLADPGARFAYDFLAFMERGQPVSVHTVAHEHHVTDGDVPLPQREATIETVEYSDGSGRLLQTRKQAEDVLFGDASFGGGVLPADQASPVGDAVGRQRATGDPPNVVVSGLQVYDNKGWVIEKFEPFFAAGPDYQPAAQAPLGQKISMFYDPRGRVIRTVNPDGSEQRVIYGVPADLTHPEQFTPTPFEVFTYDANDLATVSTGPDGASLAGAAPAPHQFTPSSTVLDALERTIESVTRNGAGPADQSRTRSTYDIRGNRLTVMDALERPAVRYTYDLVDRPLRIDSIDAGLRCMVLNAVGNEVERRDSKGALSLQAYDRLQRPMRLWARDDTGSPVTLRQRMAYGDAGTPDQPAAERAAMQARNLLGQLRRHHDEAGLITVSAVDFKGNIVDKSRQVIADAPLLVVFEEAQANGFQIVPFQVAWQPGPQQSLAQREGELLEATAYQTTASYDALNRLKRLQLPQDVEGRRRELRPEYNRAGGLEQVRLDDEVFVERIAYDAKGQRALIAYGNGVMTRYTYDPHTFRLKRLRSERFGKPDATTYHASGTALQDLGYDYDLAGNIVGIRDRVPGSGIPNNPDASPAGDPLLAQRLAGGDALDRHFDYDPIYRLISATGRECDLPPAGPPSQDQPRCADRTRARAYTERYRYDPAGNLLTLQHSSGSDGFTRAFTVEAANNHLQAMNVGNDTYAYDYDANGNLRAETTSRHFECNHADQMKVFRTQTEGAEPSVYAHYLYDAAGQRVKKLVRKQGGQVEVTHTVDGLFEHHRFGSGAQAGENNHVHVMDDQQRIALVRLGPAHPDDRGPAVQYHLGDHLGSSNVVIDGNGELVNREEFTPFGETSFGSFAKKRYRFTGKERDEESGLTYHGARYCAPWLGRWTSADPIGIQDDLNVYAYVSNNSMLYSDQSGTDKDAPSPIVEPAKATGTSDAAQRNDDRSFKQPNIGYSITHADSLTLAETKTGWQDNDAVDDSDVEAWGHWGEGMFFGEGVWVDTPPTMQNGVGKLSLSMTVEDFRDIGFPESNKTYKASAQIDFRFSQRAGNEQIQFTDPVMTYHTKGGGTMQVRAFYTPGGRVEKNGRVEFSHSLMLMFTYSSNTSRTQGSTQQSGVEVSGSSPGGGVKGSYTFSASTATTVTDTSVSWVREIQFNSYDIPAAPARPSPAPAPKGSKP